MSMSPHKSTYKVTIRIEGNLFVARDDQGNWRARGTVAGYDPKQHGDVAHWLFHHEEIESCEMVGESEYVAVIRQW